MQLVYAAQVCTSAFGSLTHPSPAIAPEVVILPSVSLERARPRISLSTFFAPPGPRLEALMRAAIFAGTEHRYDI